MAEARRGWFGGGVVHRVYSVVVFIVLASLDNVTISLAPSLYTPIGQSLGVSERALLWATGVSFLFTALAAVGWAYVGDRTNRKPVPNESCFADPGDNIPGNAPRHFSQLRGDGIRNVDMSLSKEFKVGEDKALQIRVEMFNVANHQRFAFPDAFFQDGSFGNVNQTTNNYRRMQFGARYQF